jgi:hypothetical protein
MTGFTWLQFSSFLQMVGGVDIDHEAVSLANHIHGWAKGQLEQTLIVIFIGENGVCKRYREIT